MFSRANNKSVPQREQQEVRTEQNKSVPSIISADLSVEGHLVSTGEVQVDGTVNGDIRCKALIVGVKGSVVGEIIAQTVRMHGSVKGMIRAKSVFLASTARMAGDVEHESLAIEPGAYMEGHCKRISESNLTPIMDDRRPPRTEAVSAASSSGPRLAGPPKPAMVGT
ncbi:MAG: polymer-forming cytoskeletal protein [Rhodospirillaceae bacterium]|nr:polymer-forming cytoskeletal protein [Rhodospirillaceae bacterium]